MLSVLVGFLWFTIFTIGALLIVLVLVQKSKTGGGLGGIAGGGASEEVFGSQGASILAKFTGILLVLFVVNALALNVVTKHNSSAASDEDVDKMFSQENVIKESVQPDSPVDASPENEAPVPAVSGEETAAPESEPTEALSTPTEDNAPAADAEAPEAETGDEAAQ